MQKRYKNMYFNFKSSTEVDSAVTSAHPYASHFCFSRQTVVREGSDNFCLLSQGVRVCHLSLYHIIVLNTNDRRHPAPV